jgi:prevent-host-death family protein
MSHQCYIDPMARELTQRELRNNSGEIMRALDRGESFVVTRRGVPVGELKPIGRRQFVSTAALLESLAKLPPIDYEQFRADVDAFVDQDPTPRG